MLENELITQKEKLFAIYSRKSKFTGKGESIENQIELCLKHLEYKYGKEIREKVIIFEDEGFTGANTNRPQFQKMLQELKTGKYQTLVVYRLDRISRNVLDFCKLKDKLSNWNVGFLSVTENFDTTTPMGNAMMMISSVFAQLERDTIAERIRDNMHELAKTGRWLGGTTPIGYSSKKLEKISLDGKKRSLYTLEINKKEIETVKLIFNKFLEFKGIHILESYLIQHDIKTRNGRYFRRFALNTILKNLVYCKADEDIKKFIETKNNKIYNNGINFDGKNGLISYNKNIHGKSKTGKRKTIVKNIDEWVISIGNHEGIIDGKNWIKIYNILEENGTNKRKTYGKTKHESLLSGIIKCELCKSYMRPKMLTKYNEAGKLNFSYMCEMKEKSRKQKCNCKNINGIKTDTLVLEKINELTANKKTIAKELKTINKILNKFSKKQTSNETKVLKTQLEKIDTKINNLTQKIAIVDTEVSQILNNQIIELNKKKENTLNRLNELNDKFTKQENKINETELAMKILKEYHNAWNKQNLTKKRELTKLLISSITTDGKKITIKFNYNKPNF